MQFIFCRATGPLICVSRIEGIGTNDQDLLAIHSRLQNGWLRLKIKIQVKRFTNRSMDGTYKKILWSSLIIVHFYIRHTRPLIRHCLVP